MLTTCKTFMQVYNRDEEVDKNHYKEFLFSQFMQTIHERYSNILQEKKIYMYLFK